MVPKSEKSRISDRMDKEIYHSESSLNGETLKVFMEMLNSKVLNGHLSLSLVRDILPEL